MTDMHTASQRSYNMSKILSKGAVPERVVIELLKTMNIRGFINHPEWVPGKPDIYFSNQKLAIFIDGCFWHACEKCTQMPKTNEVFWQKKLQTNVIRDIKVTNLLKAQGIEVLRIREHELKESPKKVATKINKRIFKTSTPKVLDLFAGAGGLSEGFFEKNCDIIGHIEMDKDGCETIRTRVIYHALRKRNQLEDYYQYLQNKITRDELVAKYKLEREVESVIQTEIDSNSCKKLIETVKKSLKGEKLDLIIGGPPCQAYSTIGRARMKEKVKTDKRNYLYRYYVNFLTELQPKMFVFENVPGLLSAGEGKYLRIMKEAMERSGYKVDHKIVNAPDYGIPQSRKRIIIVGWKKNMKMSYPEFKKIVRDYKVKDFLSDLPAVADGEVRRIQKYKKKSALLHELGIRDPQMKFLLDHVTRPQCKSDKEIYRLAAQSKISGKNIRYSDLPKRLKTHKNQHSFMDRFKVVDSKADSSQTVVAHISKDGHYYIHPDIEQNRSLSVREAARLQTFPDNYKFEGSRTSQFKQIGNAVPPMLSRIIANELIKYL